MSQTKTFPPTQNEHNGKFSIRPLGSVNDPLLQKPFMVLQEKRDDIATASKQMDPVMFPVVIDSDPSELSD